MNSNFFKKNYKLGLFLALYFIINILFLTKFPYVHSDEAWLSGLTRTIVTNKSLSINYPFFDLYPTVNHSMKVIFVGLQGIFLKLFGYSIHTFRLISLIVALMTLTVFYKIVDHYLKDEGVALLYTIIFSINLQLILTSHMARQDSLILLLILWAYFILIKNKKRKTLYISLCIFIGLGIHPNIFFLGVAMLLIYSIDLIRHTIGQKTFLKFIFYNSLTAVFYLATSLMINKNFISDYLNYGDHLGVINHSINRLEGLYYFFYKLFYRIGGTYFLVDLRLDFILFGIVLLLGLVLIIKQGFQKEYFYPLLMTFGLILGILTLGRYNQLSIIFVLPFIYILLIVFIRDVVSKKYILSIVIILFVIQSIHTYNFIDNTGNNDYDNFLDEFDFMSSEAKVLANLNLEYQFKDQLLDYRNLYYLKENNLTIEGYIEKNQIEYIILYEEMDYIHRNSPTWDILYGNLYYYDDLNHFINDNAELVKTFEDQTYGIRIARYVNTYPWTINIYKIK